MGHGWRRAALCGVIAWAAGACGKAGSSTGGAGGSDGSASAGGAGGTGASGGSSGSGGGSASAAALATSPPRVDVVDSAPVRASVFVRLGKDGAIGYGKLDGGAVKGGEIDLAALGTGTTVALGGLRAALGPLVPTLAAVGDGGGAGGGGAGGGDAGTAMVLDEGKVVPPPPDAGPGGPKSAREQAVAAAKQAGILSTLSSVDGSDERWSLTASKLGPDGGGDDAAIVPIVVADRAARARDLFAVLAALRGRATLAVTADGARGRAFALGFGSALTAGASLFAGDVDPFRARVVITVGGHDASVAIVDNSSDAPAPAPWKGADDPAAIGDAFAKAAATPGLADRMDVRLWTDEQATVGAVVAVMAELARRGAPEILVGDPGAGEPAGSWGTIGTGRYGTIGGGHGCGGVGGGAPIRDRAVSVPVLEVASPDVSGGDLDKAIIRRYIKRNVAKIQYCYEKELIAKPNLAGTVTTTFTIAETGSVAESKATGLPDAPAAAPCIAAVIKAIEFPRPKGGAVHVSYPFKFAASGG